MAICSFTETCFIHFYVPEWNSEASSFCPVCLSVTLWQKNFNFCHNFWTERDRNFIFGMHTQLMKPSVSNDTKVNDLLTVTFILKNSQFWTLLPPGAFVFHKRTVFGFCNIYFSLQPCKTKTQNSMWSFTLNFIYELINLYRILNNPPPPPRNINLISYRSFLMALDIKKVKRSKIQRSFRMEYEVLHSFQRA